MPITISPPVPNITINGHTYTNSNWQSDTPGTISAIANDISTIIAALSAVGTLAKTISGNTTLTGGETTNLLFIFSGSLSGDAAITFASGSRECVIVNKTTGGHQLVCGLATGATVTIPALGSQAVYCDGTDFKQVDGIARTSAGAQVSGALSVGGAAVVSGGATVVGNAVLGGTAVVSGGATLSSTLNVVGAATMSAAATVAGALTVSGGITGHGTAVVSGNTTVSGTLEVDGGEATINGTTNADLSANGANGYSHVHVNAINGEHAMVVYETAGSARWLAGREQTNETGSNAGSDFLIIRHDDAGIQLGVPITITRADGFIFFGDLPTSAAGLPSGALWLDSAGSNHLRIAP